MGSDTWGLEVLGNEVVEAAFSVHQELLVKEGIRIGESTVTDELATDERGASAGADVGREADGRHRPATFRVSASRQRIAAASAGNTRATLAVR